MAINIDFDIGRYSLSEQIARRLEQMILEDATQINNKLPSEQTLAVGFSVSRAVIREALTILKAKGLINQHQGDGSYITLPDISQVRDCVNRMVIMHKISYDEVFAARITLEIGTVHLAAENATELDIESLQEINERIRFANNDPELRAELDLEFHEKIAMIAGNQVLEIFLNSLHSSLLPMLRASVSMPGSADDGYHFHQRIIDAVKQKNAEKAQEIMRQHLILCMRNVEFSAE